MTVKRQKSSMKVRKSLSLSEETLRKGKQIASAECRTFSNLIDALVDREFHRQFPDQSAAAQIELLKANGGKAA